jgi:Cu-Zn family superoxide dismutase
VGEHPPGFYGDFVKEELMNRFMGIAALLILLPIVAAAQTSGSAKITHAIALIYPTAGSAVGGTVTFAQTDSGILIVADIDSLTPGKHGFHIHQYGNCNSYDASTAGGHFNPDNKEHGGPNSRVRHVGDLGNITADSSGVAHLEMVDKVISFSGPHSIIGRSVVIHDNEDDLRTPPSGDAGPRVACGVIGIAR